MAPRTDIQNAHCEKCGKTTRHLVDIHESSPTDAHKITPFVNPVACLVCHPERDPRKSK